MDKEIYCGDIRICEMDGCGRKHLGRGFCSIHHGRFLTYGDPLGGGPLRNHLKKPICLMEGCEKEVFHHGYCSDHYKELWESGTTFTSAILSDNSGLCSVYTCKEQAFCRTWCKRHYNHWYRTGTIEPLQKNDRTCKTEGCIDGVCARGYCKYHYDKYGRKEIKHDKCKVNDCDKEQTTGGYCDKHYRANIKYGDPLYSYRAANGVETSISPGGYRLIRVGTKLKSEHRHVMEIDLGRALLPEENVHHLNGDKLDNRIENLELWSSSQPSGQRVDDKVAWAKEILQLYGNRKYNMGKLQESKISNNEAQELSQKLSGK